MHENDASYPQRYAGRNPDLRAADQDREAIADALREQHLAGRLDTDEFQERLDRCYAAKTYGELDDAEATSFIDQLTMLIGHLRDDHPP